MKVLVIGLDGVSWEVIKPWMHRLPALRSLTHSGAAGRLTSTLPPLTCPALPSFYTGLNPGKLGVFNFIKSDGKPVTFRDISAPAIWDIAGMSGHRSTVVNIRTTYPPKKLNGIMVSGMAPSEESEYTYPPEIKDVVRGFHFENEELREMWKNKVFNEKLFSMYTERLWRRYTIFKKLAEMHPSSLMIYYIEETDSIQHWYWNNPDAILKFFIEVDKIIADIIRRFRSWNIIIFSDHGFHGAPRHIFNINTWLLNEGYLHLKYGTAGKYSTVLAHHLSNYRFIREIIARNLKGTGKSTEAPAACGTHSASSALRKFPIFLNREKTCAVSSSSLPHGIWILRKDNYRRLCGEIISKLKNLRYSGKKVVQNAWHREEVFTGPYTGHVPDIVFLLNPEFDISTKLHHKPFSDIKHARSVGSHDKAIYGIFIASGAEIRPGIWLDAINITDLAPTILHILGLPVPRYMDGRVLTEIFKPGSEPAERPVRYTDYEKRRLQNKIKKLKRRV